MGAAVLLPAILARFRALRALLAIADGFQAIRGDALLYQEILGGSGAPISQREVVLGGAALIAVAFHHYREVGILLEDLLEQRGVFCEGVAAIATDLAHVVVEERILRLLLQHVGAGEPRRGRRR